MKLRRARNRIGSVYGATDVRSSYVHGPASWQVCDTNLGERFAVSSWRSASSELVQSILGVRIDLGGT